MTPEAKRQANVLRRLARKRRKDPTALRSTAYHEACHAVAAHHGRRSGSTYRVTVVPERPDSKHAAGQHWGNRTLPVVVHGRVDRVA